MLKLASKLFLLFTALLTSLVFAREFTDAQGEMIGIIRFDAMVLDSYYSKCHANGYLYNKNLQGVRNLLQQKWGSTFDDLVRETEQRTGQNYKADADELIDMSINKFRGCNSEGMVLLINHVEAKRGANLDKFHSME